MSRISPTKLVQLVEWARSPFKGRIMSRISPTKLVQLVEWQEPNSNLVVIIDETNSSEIVITQDEWVPFIRALMYFDQDMSTLMADQCPARCDGDNPCGLGKSHGGSHKCNNVRCIC